MFYPYYKYVCFVRFFFLSVFIFVIVCFCRCFTMLLSFARLVYYYCFNVLYFNIYTNVLVRITFIFSCVILPFISLFWGDNCCFAFLFFFFDFTIRIQDYPHPSVPRRDQFSRPSTPVYPYTPRCIHHYPCLLFVWKN